MAIIETTWVNVSGLPNIGVTIQKHGLGLLSLAYSAVAPTIESDISISDNKVRTFPAVPNKSIWLKSLSMVSVTTELDYSTVIRDELLHNILNNNPSSFLEGKDFRAYKELDIPNGASQILEIVVPADIYLDHISLNIDSGNARYSSLAGGTSTGASVLLPTVFNKNSRSDAGIYTRLLVPSIVDGVTGGTELDVARLKTGTNNQAVSVIESAQSKRGIAAGTYHLVVDNIGAGSVAGVLYAHWSEWP